MDSKRLGDQTTFRPIDVSRMADQLSLAERGTQNGNANQPAATSAIPDDVESQIIQEIGAIRSRVVQDTQIRLESINKQVADSRASMNTGMLENSLAPVLTGLEQNIMKDTLDLEDTRQKLKEERQYFSKWRERRKLLRPAKEPKSAFNFFADLFIIAIVEGGLNLFFFTENNPLGMAGAFLQALLIAGANILACTVIGFVLFKRVNSIMLSNKVLGFLSILVFMIGLPFVHFIVGFYRVARSGLTEETEGSLLWNAIEWATQFEVHRLDELSIVLILVGIVAGAYAARKGYEFGDKYPDYTKTYWSYQGRRMDYLDHLDDVAENIQSEHARASALVGGFLHGLGSSLKSIEEYQARKTQLSVSLKTYDEHLLEATRQLLAEYRNANRRARTEPAPSHFDKSFVFESPLFDKNGPTDRGLAEQLARHAGIEAEATQAAKTAKTTASSYQVRIQAVLEKTNEQLDASAVLREDGS